MRKMLMTAIAACLALAGGLSLATPAQAIDGYVWNTVGNNDGTNEYVAQVYMDDVHTSGYAVATAFRVWNCTLADNCHTNTLTNVQWHWVDENNVVHDEVDMGNVADGATDPWNGYAHVKDGTTLWVEVHDNYAPTCTRVFFGANGGTSQTTC